MGSIATWTRRSWARAVGVAAIGVGALVVALPSGSPVVADPGDYWIDFTAAAPQSYDHSTGGGSYNDRTVGVDKDIVESLEGGDFACLEIVTYLTQIRRDGTPDTFGQEDHLKLNYSFLADTTGQSGVAMTDITLAEVNSGVSDSGHVDAANPSSAELTAEWIIGTPFQKGAELHGTVLVKGVDPGDQIVVRVDVLLDCDTPRPTGNLQAALTSTDVVWAQSGVTGRVPVGEQTVPFKQIRRIYPIACPEQDFFYDGQDDSCNEGLPQPGAVQSSDTSSGVAIVGDVAELLGGNLEASTALLGGGLIGVVAIRRRGGRDLKTLHPPD